MKQRSKIFILLFLFVIKNLYVFSQAPLLDSLKQVLRTVKHDTSRIIISAQLTEICDEQDIFDYANRTLSLSEKLLAQNIPGWNKRLMKLKSDAFNNLGYTLQQKGNNAGALQYYEKSLQIKRNIKDDAGMAGILNNIGFVHNVQGRIEVALKYYLESLGMLEKTDDKKSVAIALNNLGSLYEHQNEIAKAKEYYLRSSETAKSINDLYESCVPLVNLAALYDKEGNSQKAIELNLYCIDIFQKARSHFALLTCYNNLGEIYREDGYENKNKQHFFIAYQCYKHALEESEKSGDKLGGAFALNNLASLCYMLNKRDSAEMLAKRVFELGKQLGSPEVIKRASYLLSTIYSYSNRFREALEMQETHIRMRDSINNETTRRSAIRSHLKYEYERKSTADSVAYVKEAELKNTQIEKQNAEITVKKNQQYALFGGLFLVMVFAGLIYNRFKVTQKQKRVIEQQKTAVESQKHLVEEKQREILDSIYYARRIQQALITNEAYIQKNMDKLNK